MADRPYPDLLSADARKALLADAEYLVRGILKNDLDAALAAEGAANG